MMILSENSINLSTPYESIRERGFQPPWYTVWLYRCDVGHIMRVKANSFLGKVPVPSSGAIMCPQCENKS